MSFVLQSVIARSKTIPGFVNPVAYDDNRLSSYGYWICKNCKQSFSSTHCFHQSGCNLEGQKFAQNSNVIYVLGPNDDGTHAPYRQTAFDMIKEIAKSRFIESEREKAANVSQDPDKA